MHFTTKNELNSREFAEEVYALALEAVCDSVYEYEDDGYGSEFENYYPGVDFPLSECGPGDVRGCAGGVHITNFLRLPEVKEMFVQWCQQQANKRELWLQKAKG